MGQQKSSFYLISSECFTKVEITYSFRKERMETNREITIPFNLARKVVTLRISALLPV